jgi:hypothetical protein
MADLTTVQVYANNISNISQVVSTTVLSQSSGTINLASLSLSDTAPADVARTASAGSSNVAARADHVHSAASLLMDGGNY